MDEKSRHVILKFKLNPGRDLCYLIPMSIYLNSYKGTSFRNNVVALPQLSFLSLLDIDLFNGERSLLKQVAGFSIWLRFIGTVGLIGKRVMIKCYFRFASTL